MPPKKKQHKCIENRGKLKKGPDFKSLQKAKDRLTKQVQNRKKELAPHPTENRYQEVREALTAPEAPVIEQTAAHEAYRAQYFSQFKRVVDGADVLLEILDARDPLGCRSKKLEDHITHRGKKLVLLLNKIDLIPMELMNKWLVLLRKEFPTYPFKASNQPNKATIVPIHDGKWRGSDVYGVQELIHVLNGFAGGSTITAGVFGPPNTGKSSVINSLSRRPAAGVGSTPGFTKTMQEIEVTKKIRILDCPGVVYSNGSDITPSMVLRNSVKIELLTDPITPVEFILERVPKEQLVSVYGIGTYSDAEDFLTQIAMKRGRIKKGGEPDLDAVARNILDDWNKGRIRYFTVPPDIDDGIECETEIVAQDGSVMQIGKVMDLDDTEYRNYQVQHVFQVVTKTKKEERQEQDEPSDYSDSEEEPKKISLGRKEAEKLDELASAFEGVSFGDI